MYDLLFDFYRQHLSISYRFRDIRLQSFLGLTLTFDPKRSSGFEKIYTIQKPVWFPIWLLWTPSLSCTVLEIFDFKVFRVWPWPLTLKGHPGSNNCIPFESPHMTSYLTSIDTISLSRTFLEIFDFKVFRVWPWPLTPRSHLGSQIFIPFESLYMTSYLTSMDTISLSRTVLVIFDFKVFRVWPWPLTPKSHLSSKKFIPFESPYMTSYLTSMDTISLSCTVLEIFDFKVFRVWPWPLNPKCHPGSNNCIPFESPHMTSYSTSMDTISLSRTVLEIFDFKVFRVWPRPLTPKGHLGSKNFIPFESSYMTSYLTSMNTISLSRTVFEIFVFKVFRVWPWPLNPKCHPGSNNCIPFESPHMTSYSTSMNTISLSRTVFEIFVFKVFRVWPWPLTPKCHPGSNNCIPFESQHMTSYSTSMDTISLSRTVLEIFDFKVFKVWPWLLTPKGHLGSKKISYHPKAYIWLPIWLLWTPSLYLVPFSWYSISKFLGFDLDLWPQNVIWVQKNSYHSKARIWLPIWLLWTPSLYLVPFSKYSISKFLGFDLDLWPLKVIWGRKILYHSKAHIWLPIWLLWTPSLYLVPFSRYSSSKFLGFDLDLWPQNVIRGQTIVYPSKARIWLPIRLLWTPSLYLVPFSRYSTSKFLRFDLDLWPLKVIWGRKKFHTIRKPIYDFLFDFYGHHLSISYRSRDIRFQSF